MLSSGPTARELTVAVLHPQKFRSGGEAVRKAPPLAEDSWLLDKEGSFFSLGQWQLVSSPRSSGQHHRGLDGLCFRAAAVWGDDSVAKGTYCQPDNLSSIPGPIWWKERTNAQEWSSCTPLLPLCTHNKEK